MPRARSTVTLLDAVVLLALLGAAAWLVYRVKVGLNYHWNWDAMPQYLVRYDRERGRWVASLLLQGLFTTVRLSLWSMVLATVIGTAMGLCRVSRRLFFRLVGRSYVELMRNLPPLVLIFIFYFFVSDQIMPLIGLDDLVRSQSEPVQRLFGVLFARPGLITAFASAVVALSLIEGAYIAEIVRAGIQSVEKGQWDAARALGFSRWQRMRHVILPLAVQRIVPPLGGQFISTIKDSSIVSVISIRELTFQGTELMAVTYFTIEIWVVVSLLYLLLTLTCSLLVERIEVRLSRGRGDPFSRARWQA